MEFGVLCWRVSEDLAKKAIAELIDRVKSQDLKRWVKDRLDSLMRCGVGVLLAAEPSLRRVLVDSVDCRCSSETIAILVESLLGKGMLQVAVDVMFAWTGLHPLLRDGAEGLRVIGQFAVQNLGFLEDSKSRCGRLWNPVRKRRVERILDSKIGHFQSLLDRLREIEGGVSRR